MKIKLDAKSQKDKEINIIVAKEFLTYDDSFKPDWNGKLIKCPLQNIKNLCSISVNETSECNKEDCLLLKGYKITIQMKLESEKI